MFQIIPITAPIKSSIILPSSKSLTNRAFLIAALAKGKSTIINPLLSDDTKYMINALKKLGIKIIKQGQNYIIYGNNGKFTTPYDLQPTPYNLFLGNAGTATRFLTSACSLCANLPLKITGNKRMQERPIQDLINGLNQLGAKVYSEKNNNCPPVIIEKPLIGGTCEISGRQSSQYFSALLIAAPYAKKDVTIKVLDDLVSKPYLDQTIDLMNKFGIKVRNINYRQFKIKAKQSYQATKYEVEADASSATYFTAIAAITGSTIRINNLNPETKQADIGILEVLKKMGCEIKNSKLQIPNTKQISNSKLQIPNFNIMINGSHKLKPLGKINLNHMPDGAMTVAILCAFAKGKSILTGLENLKIKETDRLKALSTELNKIGCDCQETSDGLIINGNSEKLHGATIETYDDHRMAMCFTIAGTKIPGIKIKNPNCVKKTYPGFWKDLKKAGIRYLKIPLPDAKPHASPVILEFEL